MRPRVLFILVVLGGTGCGEDGKTSADAGMVLDSASLDAQPAFDAALDASVLPVNLAETGLYSDFASETLAEGVLAYSPLYPMWNDGATKRRWVKLPEGTTIDTSDMDYWALPVGTKLWKELSLGGQRIETRYLWKTGPDTEDWFYVSFAWNAANTEALAVPDGVEDALGTPLDIPSDRGCAKCHERQADFALGFSAIQLAHQEPGENLGTLVANDRLTVAPSGAPPYFSVPGVGDEQAVLGYMHSNCGGCHHKTSDVMATTVINLRLEVASLGSPQETPAYVTTVGVAPMLGAGSATSLIEPGNPAVSAVYLRMSVRGSALQMPPRGTEVSDGSALVQLEAWILGLL